MCYIRFGFEATLLHARNLTQAAIDRAAKYSPRLVFCSAVPAHVHLRAIICPARENIWFRTRLTNPLEFGIAVALHSLDLAPRHTQYNIALWVEFLQPRGAAVTKDDVAVGKDFHVALADGEERVFWVGEFLEEGCSHCALVDGEEDAGALVDVGYDCAVVVVEEGDCSCVWGAGWVDACVVLVAEGEVVGEGKVAS
jgi:hypothetical protein